MTDKNDFLEKAKNEISEACKSNLGDIVDEIDVQISFRPKIPIQHVNVQLVPEQGSGIEPPDFIGLDDLFPFGSDYNSKELVDVFRPGHLYHYIPSSFLNGYINHVEIVKAYLMERYIRHGAQYGADVWQPFLDGGERCHSLLGALKDDVVILGASEQYWWFFWFDCDVSDCIIGRAKRTLHSLTQARKWFDDHVENSVNYESAEQREQDPAWPVETSWEGVTGYREIPLDALKGWIKF